MKKETTEFNFELNAGLFTPNERAKASIHLFGKNYSDLDQQEKQRTLTYLNRGRNLK